jgi:hypothetical protein
VKAIGRRGGAVRARCFALCAAAGMLAFRFVLSSAGLAQDVTPANKVTGSPTDAADERSFMHGIGQADGGNRKTWIFFSSSGLPPRGANRDGSWPHDVYVGEWSPGDPRVSRVRIFIKRPEAQEPVSVAQNTSGNIFITFEDGWNAPRTISQRYGVYRRDLTPIKPYPKDVESGGHSGHVAAIGEQFIVVYSADWVEGGGLGNRGTGNGVYAKVFDARGQALWHTDVAARTREEWPIVAGSPQRALVVWQKYIPDSTSALLEYALVDPHGRKLIRPADSIDPFRVQYYAYAASYVPDIDRFLVVTTLDSRQAVAFLIDNEGRRTAELGCLPAVVRESGIAVLGGAAYLPTQDGQLMTLALQADRIVLRGTQRAPFAWGDSGNTAIANGSQGLYVVTLTAHGLRETNFDLRHEVSTGQPIKCLSPATQ